MTASNHFPRSIRLLLSTSMAGLLAACSSTGGLQPSQAAPLLTRTAQHDVRIEQGRCTPAALHTCSPDLDGNQTSLIVTLTPLAAAQSGTACTQPISDLAASETALGSQAAKPLAVEFAGTAGVGGCGLRACFSVLDFKRSLLGGPTEVTLSWLAQGQVQSLPQRIALRPAAGGRFVLALGDAPLDAAGVSLALPGAAPVKTDLLAR
jgi:hypothetical protein